MILPLILAYDNLPVCAGAPQQYRFSQVRSDAAAAALKAEFLIINCLGGWRDCRSLMHLCVQGNRLTSLPREIGVGSSTRVVSVF